MSVRASCRRSAGIVAGSINGLRTRAGIEGVSPEIHIQMPLKVDDEDRLVLLFLIHRSRRKI